MNRFRFPLLAILAMCWLTIGQSAKTQVLTFLDMSVLPPIQIGSQGDTKSWDIQLINNNPDTAYFVFTGFNDGLGANPDITVPTYNLTPFGQQFTLSPGAGATITGMFETRGNCKSREIGD